MTMIREGNTTFHVSNRDGGFKVQTKAPRKGGRNANDHKVFRDFQPGSPTHAHGVELWANEAHAALLNLLAAYEQVWAASAPPTALPIQSDPAFQAALAVLGRPEATVQVIQPRPVFRGLAA